jgi:hypothetical protein
MNYGAAVWVNDILVLTEDRELSWDSEKKWKSNTNSSSVIHISSEFENIISGFNDFEI